MREPCDCPSEHGEYDEGTEDVIAGGTDAEKKAEKTARREAERARQEAEAGADVCKIEWPELPGRVYCLVPDCD